MTRITGTRPHAAAPKSKSAAHKSTKPASAKETTTPAKAHPRKKVDEFVRVGGGESGGPSVGGGKSGGSSIGGGESVGGRE